MPTAKPPLQYEHVWAGDQRLYRINGVVRPGVTSVLSVTSDQSWKVAWLEKYGEEECRRRAERGCNRGTLLHWLIEDYFGEARDACPVFWDNLPDEDVIDRMFESVKPVLRSLKPIGIETTLEWSCDDPVIGRGFAGLADFVGEITTGANAGSMVLADWKTTAYTPLSTASEKIAGYRQQLAAYRAAIRQMDPERYAELNRTLIVVIPEKGDLQLVPLGQADLMSSEMAFVSRLRRYYQQHWPAQEAADLEASMAA